VDDFADVEALTPALEKEGFMRRNWYDDTQMIYAIGEDVPPDDRITTHFIHIVKIGSPGWYDYIYFRDYLNAMPSIAKEYESIKTRLATENPLMKSADLANYQCSCKIGGAEWFSQTQGQKYTENYILTTELYI